MGSDWHAPVYRPPEDLGSAAWWKEIRTAVMIRDRFKCFRCESKRRRGLSVHHIVPRSEGGEDNLENLITLCNKCHDIVEMAACRSLADIVATIEDDSPHQPKKKEEPEKDRIETFERPEWHKWVYGGQRKPT